MKKLENTSYSIFYPANMDVKLILEAENMWSDLESIAALYGVSVFDMKSQLESLYEEKVVSKRETVATGPYYNLPAIVAVGYRFNAKKATEFNVWANRIVREYILSEYFKKPNKPSYFEKAIEGLMKVPKSKKSE